MSIQQMCMITARTPDILETLPYYEKFMPWITRLVVCCPEKTKKEIIAAYNGAIDIDYVTDEELFGQIPIPRDHQIRNFMIRALVMKTGKLDELFIMGDDDNRPLKKIDEEFFVSDEKYHLYYYYTDGHNWHGAPGAYTSYDTGILNTTRFLEKRGLGTKLFSVHAPQVIVRDVYLEALNKYPEAVGDSVDEWSFYGNYACDTYQDRFDSRPYETMCWPGMPTDWLLDIRPERYSFENFYEGLYKRGGLFQDFDTEFSDGQEYINGIKARIRKRIQDEYDDKRNGFEKNILELSFDCKTAALSMMTYDDICQEKTKAFEFIAPSNFVAKLNVHLTNRDCLPDVANDVITIKYTFYGIDGKRPRMYRNEPIYIKPFDDEIAQLPINTPNKAFDGKLRIEVKHGKKTRVYTIKMRIE